MPIFPGAIRWLKPTVFIACLWPFLSLVIGIMTSSLGADPQKALVHATGIWTLRFLLITLSVTPLRQLSGWNRLQGLRRMLGLYAFFYACLHVTSYAVLYVGLDWNNILGDVVKRPYITVGFAAYLGLLPLAITSTNRMMKRLGKDWVKLHRLVYGIVILGCVHFLWLVKSDLNEPLIYAMVAGGLLVYRIVQSWKRTRNSRKRAPRPQRSLVS